MLEIVHAPDVEPKAVVLIDMHASAVLQHLSHKIVETERYTGRNAASII